MSQPSGVYITDDFSEPMTAQHNFTENFDMENPAQAMSVYARIMHEHTQRQLNMATNSARRRSEGPTTPDSSTSSVNSSSS